MIAPPQSLSKDHILESFDCGSKPLTEWLKKHALQSQQSGQTRTMVITDKNNIVIGYYAYNVISVEHESSTPQRVKKGLSRQPIPVFLIARLAIDLKYQGQRLGERLLLSALRGAASITGTVPIRAIIVDALNEEAKQFYLKFDFEPFPPDSLRMWLLMKDLLKTLNLNQSL